MPSGKTLYPGGRSFSSDVLKACSQGASASEAIAGRFLLDNHWPSVVALFQQVRTSNEKVGTKIVRQKNSFFKKRSGEVIENTGQDYMSSQKQTEKQSGEVVENTYPWKKQTGANLKTKLPISLKIKQSEKQTKREPGRFTTINANTP